MAKGDLTSYAVRKIIEKVWAENDTEIELTLAGEATKRHVAEYLNVAFYTWKKRADNPDKTYALIEAKTEETPLDVSVDYKRKNVRVTFLVNEGKIEALEHYVQILRDNYLGALTEFNDYSINAYLDFGILEYDKQPEHGALGRNIVCSFTLILTYTPNIITGGQKVWLLDGEKLPYVDEGVDLDKSGATNTIYGAKATQTVPAVQSRFYRFSLPYISDNPVCRGLQRDILDGDMQKIYTLTFYDGVVYTEAEPLTVKVTLFRTSKSAGKITASTTFDVWFAEADDNTKGRVQYEMALIDNAFDSECLNTRWFASQAEQQAWFKIRTDATTAPYRAIKAPNIGSLTISMQTYFAPLNASLDSLLTKNYAVIKATEGEAVRYYYYFVTSANVGADNQISVNLQMDVIQTYYFNPNIEIAPCMINRAHLNRWIDNGDGTVSFDGRPESLLFGNENISASKRLTHRNRLVFKYDTSTSDDIISPIDKWLDDNVAYWNYIFIKGNQEYTTSNLIGYADKRTIGYTRYGFNDGAAPGSSYLSGWGLLVYPVMKNTGSFIEVTFGNMQNQYYPRWDEAGIEQFKKYNGLTSYYYASKLSCRAPFFTQKLTDYVSITEGQFSVMTIAMNPSIAGIDFFPISSTVAGSSISAVANLKSCLSSKNKAYPYFLPDEIRNTFLKSEIINATQYKSEYNPKILSENFMELRITNGVSESFSYDIQKIDAKEIVFEYTETLFPDITRQYAAMRPKAGSIYIEATKENYTGLVGSIDNSLPYDNDQLSAFLAQNKNFYLQRDINMGMDIAKTAVSFGTSVQGNAANLAMGVATGNVGQIAGGAQGMQGAGISAAMSAAQIAVDRVQSNLTLDNMRNAPGILKNANGNAIFNAAVCELGFYVEIYSALANDIKRACDYINMYGFSFRRVDTIKNHDNIRVKYNYVEAEIENIRGKINEEARGMFKRLFRQGIRFWKQDEVDYTKENYEEILNSN